MPTVDSTVGPMARVSESAALVQVLALGVGNVIYPPSLDGTPHPDNRVVYETRIGMGVYPDGEHLGRFSAAISPRPSGGTKLFVRVFNASSTEASSFYGDSDIFVVSWASNSQFSVNIEATDIPLDVADDDDDGLINSWETSLGSDSGVIDTDGDGLSDNEEFLRGMNPTLLDSDGDGISDPDELLTGTDPTRSDSALAITAVSAPVNGQIQFAWISITGLVYQIESVSPNQDAAVSASIELPGNGGAMVTAIRTEDVQADNQWFRLKVYKP